MRAKNFKNHLYVSDMDRTLLRSDGTLSDYSRHVLQRLLQQGLWFTVASARAWSEMTPILKDLPLHLPVIAVNGAYLTDYKTGKHIVINDIQIDLATAIFHNIKDYKLSPFIVGFNGQQDCLFWDHLINPEMQWYHDMLVLSGDKRLMRLDRLADAFRHRIIAFAVMGDKSLVSELHQRLAELFPGKLENFLFENPYSPGHWWLTIHDQKACKSKALRTLMELCAITPQQLTVFGDHINDIKMFELAGTAIAVANAEQVVKNRADVIIGSNDQDAVVDYIQSQFYPDFAICLPCNNDNTDEVKPQ